MSNEYIFAISWVISIGLFVVYVTILHLVMAP
jgi:hypothetical protein